MLPDLKNNKRKMQKGFMKMDKIDESSNRRLK